MNVYCGKSIKLLLIRPLKRWKVLLSKYLAVLLFTLDALIILFIASFLVGGIVYGFSCEQVNLI